jgi:hypothetical protein
MKKRTLILLVVAAIAAMVVVGCGITIDVPVGTNTYIKICSNSGGIYGTLYVNGISYGKIDGANIIGPRCRSGIGPLILGNTYYVEVIDWDYGTGDYSTYITPRFSDQTINLPY